MSYRYTLSTSACCISEERLRGYCVRSTPHLALEKFMSAFILKNCARLAHLREQKDPNPYFGREKHLIISNEVPMWQNLPCHNSLALSHPSMINVASLRDKHVGRTWKSYQPQERVLTDSTQSV